MAKYLFVTGGVYSGTGKGVACASLALLMKMRGRRVEICKMDGYLNTNASVLSPVEHGETYVCADGSETDLDLGSYSRITGIEVGSRNIITGGSLYKELIEEQENGVYSGQTVQTSTHLVRKIIEKLLSLGQGNDIVFVEIGGTVGDIESAPFLEAIRQFKIHHPDDVMVCMVAPVLWVPTIAEFKTKPLQNSVKLLQSAGVQPDMVVCRTDRAIPVKVLQKVADLSNVPHDSVFEAPDVRTVYECPVFFWQNHVDDLIADRFHFQRNGVRIHRYKDLVERYVNAGELPSVEVGVVCKYQNAEEAYVSLKEALYHAGLANDVRVNRRWVGAEDVERAKDIRGVRKILEGLDAIVVPGGFDRRGIEGKIKAAKYARENRVPFLGICLGLQCAVIEFARNVCGLDGANSVEFDEGTPHPVVHFVEGQEGIRKKSGTMRLGAFPCELVKDSVAFGVYGKKAVSERHRHRYEVNAAYVERLGRGGLAVSGTHPPTGLVEVMEIADHPYFIGTQAHPEFKSFLGRPAPLFSGLVAAAAARAGGKVAIKEQNGLQGVPPV